MSLKTTPTPDAGPPKAPPPAPLPPLEAIFKGNRPLAAAALLVLIEIVPAAGLWVALRENAGVWIVFSAVLMAGGLFPPVGVLLGQAWGYVLGQYVCWGTLVGVVLRVMSMGFSPLYLLPAVLLGVLLVALSSARPQGREKRTERKPESIDIWIKENIEAIIIAFIMALVIRCFCIEVFKIPSSSMEPTLLGDVYPAAANHRAEDCTFRDYHVPGGGDRIMVTKYYYAFSDVERYDVVVFKFPLNQAKNFIKRVVGLPNEELKVYKGNLYVKKPNEQKFHIARRSLRIEDSIWIDPAKGTDGYLGGYEDFMNAWDVGPDSTAKTRIAVRERELSTQEAAGQRSTEFVYHQKPNDARNIRYEQRALDDGEGQPVGDMHLAFECEITSPKGQVFAEIVNEWGRFEAVLDTDGGSMLRFQDPKGRKEDRPLGDIHLAMDKSYKVDLAILDGTAYVRVNGFERARIPFIDTREDITENDHPDRRIAFGTRGLTFKVKNLALGRDIFYRARTRSSREMPEEGLKTGPGQYVMMGDNVANSHDSRAWVKKTVHLADGRTYEYEAQQQTSRMEFLQQLKERFNLPQVPDWAIEGDVHGNDVPIFESDHPVHDPDVAFPFVDQKFIVGKALWIWWPQGRWFHLIR